MKVIIGLGNPGIQYEFTRHNAGFRVVTEMAVKNGGHFSNKKSLYCDLAKISVSNTEILLVKPTTYMNDSGRSVLAVLQWYKLLPEQALIVHDDVSLPLGKLRLQKNGGAGGQHGVESIIEYWGGNKEFQRLKFGVGPDPGGDLRANYVLAKFPENEKELFEHSLHTSLDAINIWIRNDIQEAMNKFNGLQLPISDPEIIDL